MKFKKITSGVLIFAMALTLLAPGAINPAPSYGATFTDTSSHWAEKYINSAVSKGIVKGYADGKFKPDNPVSRAEFACMVNKALGNTATATINFNDVPYSEWYYNDISKAVAATYVSGYADSSFKPNAPISREEAAVIISRIVPSYGASGNIRAFGDFSSISEWAYTSLEKANGKGYIGAYDDGKIHPKDQLTRAQTAKIICDITDKETIISSAPIVKASNTNLSGKIYSNGVTIHKDLGENNATIDNCVILGNLLVQGGGVNSVILNNSRIATCTVAKSDSTVRVLAKGETFILDTDVSYAAKLETSNLSGTDFGVGFYRLNANSSSDVLLSGSFPRVNVVGSNSKLKLESGVINLLEVGSSSRSSDITVDGYGTVTKANVNGAAAFHGDGNIREMNANANGITYEKRPSDLKVDGSVSTKPSETNRVLSITFDPANSAKNISVNKQITITFSQAITKYNGKTIANSELKDFIYFNKDSKSGSAIPFSATINSSRKIITITPDKNLTTDTKYYISFDRNVFKDENGEGNAAQSIYFTVGTGSVDGITFYPVNDSTAVKASIEPTISFEEAIETYSGDEITAKYLKNNIVFKTKSASGSDVSFSATINSKYKVITITPSSNLTSGQKYYIGFESRVFRTRSDDKSVSGQNVTWTAGSTAAPTISLTPATNSAGIAPASTVTLQFSERIYNSSAASPNSSYITGAISFRNNSTGTSVPYSVSYTDSSNSSRIILTPTAALTAGQSYSVVVAANNFRNADGVYNAAASTTFTIANNIDVTVINTAITRANTAKNSVIASIDGSDIYNTNYWATATQIATLNNAIATATNAKASVQSAAAATTIASTLDAATTTFEAAKKLGSKIKIDVTVIDTSVTNANAAKTGILTSADGSDVDAIRQWVTSAQLLTLNQAITTAEAAKGTVQSVEAANAAAATLNSAVLTFNGQKDFGTKVIIDKSALSTAINNAKDLKDATLINSDPANVALNVDFVTDAVSSNFDTQISSARSVLLNSAATKNDVDSALLALNDATAAFNLAKQKGTKVL